MSICADIYKMRFPWQTAYGKMESPDSLHLDHVVTQTANAVGSFVEELLALGKDVDAYEWHTAILGDAPDIFIEKFASSMTDLHEFDVSIVYERLIGALVGGVKSTIRDADESRPPCVYVEHDGAVFTKYIPSEINHGISFQPDCLDDKEYNALLITNLGDRVNMCRLYSVDLEFE